MFCLAGIGLIVSICRRRQIDRVLTLKILSNYLLDFGRRGSAALPNISILGLDLALTSGGNNASSPLELPARPRAALSAVRRPRATA